jgi:hypothetical protein
LAKSKFKGLHKMGASIDLQDQMPLIRLLGLGGLLPFFGLAAGVLLLPQADWRSLAFVGLSVYAVAILSFLGAIHWGLAMASGGLTPPLRSRLLAYGVLPALVGCGLFFLPGGARLIGLALAFLVAYWFDRSHREALGLPGEWLRLRTQLTLGAVVALGVPGVLAI